MKPIATIQFKPGSMTLGDLGKHLKPKEDGGFTLSFPSDVVESSSNDEPTGTCLVLVTPDGERTAEVMRDEGVYVVPMEGAVRVALCSTPEAAIPRLVEALRMGLEGAEG